MHFLRRYLQYCLLQHHLGQSPTFTHEQQRWAQAAAEFSLAEEIVRHWQRRVAATPHAGEQLFLALLFKLRFQCRGKMVADKMRAQAQPAAQAVQQA
ncbi:hypothetical protein V7P28_29940 [Klebsiella michiganensis]